MSNDSKKIVMIGNFEVSYCTENDFAWSYEQLGFEVVKMQEQKARTEDILKACKGAKLVHYVHTHGWKTPGLYTMEQLFKEIRKLNVPIISVHLDYWRGLEREKDVGTHPFWKTDYVFTADGGSNDWYRAKGINHFYLKAGVVAKACRQGTVQDRFKHDVIFVGSKGYHKEWAYRPKLINWLEEAYGDRFALYGGDGKGVVREDDLNDLYASAKVVVGDTLCLNFDHPDYFSDRLFETTGRGGFLIFPYIKGIEDCFKLEEEIVTYKFNDFDGSPIGLKSKIDYYVKHDLEREKIRFAGFQRTSKDHTYTNRIKQMLIIITEQEM